MRRRGLVENFKADGTEKSLVVLQDTLGAKPSVTGSVTEVVEEQPLWGTAATALDLLLPLHAVLPFYFANNKIRVQILNKTPVPVTVFKDFSRKTPNLFLELK